MIMCPPTKLQVIANFDPKNVAILYPPLHSPDLSPPDYFLFPRLKMTFADVAETQEAVTDKLKKVQKEAFSAAFHRNCMTAQSLYICQWSLF